MSKFKLSDTMRFLTGKINAITGGEVSLTVHVTQDAVRAGDELRAEVRVRSPEVRRNIDYVQISIKGQVQRDGKWHDWVQSAEVAQDTALPADHEFIVPVVVKIPVDAVLSEDNAQWSIYARAFLDKKFDPRAEAAFVVVVG